MTDARERLEALVEGLRCDHECGDFERALEGRLQLAESILDAMPEGPDSGWIDAGTRESVSAPHDTHGPGVYRASVGYVETPALGNYRIWLKPEEDAE
jgi:hypothetical protein